MGDWQWGAVGTGKHTGGGGSRDEPEWWGRDRERRGGSWGLSRDGRWSGGIPGPLSHSPYPYPLAAAAAALAMN